MRASRRSRRLSPAVVGVLVIAQRLVACDELAPKGPDRDGVLCEEAMSHLDACCPGFDAHRVSCASYNEYDLGGNKIGHVYPEFSEEDLRCMLDADCNDLAKVCDAVRSRPPTTPRSTRVCG